MDSIQWNVTKGENDIGIKKVYKYITKWILFNYFNTNKIPADWLRMAPRDLKCAHYIFLEKNIYM